MEARESERKAPADAVSSTPTTKDIWLLLSSMEPPSSKASSESKTSIENNQSSTEERDTFTLVVGSKSSGKTSLFNAYVHRGSDEKGGSTEEVKPTTGLEYVYVRQNGAVAHIWELASLRCVPEMMRVPLAPERILQSAVVVVIDLSNPGDAVLYLIKWLTTVYRIVNEILKTKEKNPVEKSAVEKLRRVALDRFGKDHADKDDVTPIAIPVLIIGNKFDVLAQQDNLPKKPLLQALRFFAHLYGATLLLTTTKEKPCVNQMRGVFKSYIFGMTGNLKNSKKDVDSASKPQFVPVGSDSFSEIGLPDGARKEDLFGPVNDVDAKAKPWKKYLAKVIEPSGSVTDDWDNGDDKGKTPESDYPEPNIDRARQRKLDELTRYRDARKKMADKGKRG